MPSDSDILLESLLDQAEEAAFESNQVGRFAPPIPEGPEREKKKETGTHSQWAIGSNGRFMPVGSTVPTLTAGVYQPFSEPGSWGLESVGVISDGLYHLPDMATEEVLEEVRKFWESEEKYKSHSLLYKRGVLMWGAPGSGKTVAVKLLMNELVRRGGIVILANHVELTVLALKAIKRIEPSRNLIVVFEDIDEIINYNGEAGVLSLLDGEASIDRVLNLATTNYPERLGARIVNRPSRFDRRVYVGMPSDAARFAYLEKTTGGNLEKKHIERWVADTKDMSIAHLRELVAAVYCLDQPYDEVIERLRAMSTQPQGESGFKPTNKMGFGATTTAAKTWS
jgi:hypothetical protein